jgi:TatD DNase family protein
MARYFDIHSHIASNDFDSGREEIIDVMEEEGILTATIGVDYVSSREAARFAEATTGVYASVGCHPVDNTREIFQVERYRELVRDDSKIVAIGECGLDYFRLTGEQPEEKKRQRELFEEQVALAHELSLPLMIHARTREAHEEVIAILKNTPESKVPIRANIHFFTESTSIARQYYDLGCTTSFTGVITFTTDYDEVARYAPADRICVETDAPYATPVPHRGKRNDPTYIPLIVERLAAIRSVDTADLRELLLQNSLRLFQLSAAEKQVN